MTGGIVPTSPEAGQLVIERLAAALEQAVRVDEIKDVRDRAMAIQLYSRKKQGGLAAAMAAGRIVTGATLKLAKLYAEEKSAKGSNLRTGLTDGSVLPSGKQAIAEAADMHAPNLARLRPLVDTARDDLNAAMGAIEERGDVVTPHALLREVTGEPGPRDPTGRVRIVVVIGGRRLSTAQVAALAMAVGDRAARTNEPALRDVQRMLQGRTGR